MTKKILIDPGHGGTDSGAVGWGLLEKDMNLPVALLLAEKLAIYDAEVRLTRMEDDTLSMESRRGMAKAWEPDLFISCHHNGSTSQNARGVEVFYSYQRPGAKGLAARIAAGIAAGGTANRGAKTQRNAAGVDYHQIIRWMESATTAAIIVEGGFITNAADAELIRTEAWRELEAQVIADAAAEYLELTPKEVADQVPAWQSAGFAALRQRGIITTPEYWANKLDRPVTAGEMMGILAKM